MKHSYVWADEAKVELERLRKLQDDVKRQIAAVKCNHTWKDGTPAWYVSHSGNPYSGRVIHDGGCYKMCLGCGRYEEGCPSDEDNSR
jgi:hypothetical protein